MVPLGQRQKFLQGPWRHIHEPHNRLHALALQIAELAGHVFLEMVTRVEADKAVGELIQVAGRAGLNTNICFTVIRDLRVDFTRTSRMIYRHKRPKNLGGRAVGLIRDRGNGRC